MKNLYLSEVNRELGKTLVYPGEHITENDIAFLPEPVKKYFRYCGYVGKEKMINAEVKWGDVYLKISPKKKWMKIKCYQINSVPEPSRIVYMKSNMFGIFPFEGRDKYQDGHGNMLIKLLKLIQIADEKTKEMDQSALVTVLAEALLVPTYALQSYITWEQVDQRTAKAVIRYNGNEVSGIFYFDDDGRFTRFTTEDRFYTENNGSYKKVKWSGIAGDYIEKNGIKFPSSFKGVWNTEDGDYEYFKGTICDIKFNIKQ